MTRPDEEGPIDLSALALEPARFDALVSATLARADAYLQPRDPIAVIASWSRPLLLAAATLVLALVPVEYLLERRESRAEQVQRLVTLSADHAYGAEPLPPIELLRAVAPRVRQ